MVKPIFCRSEQSRYISSCLHIADALDLKIVLGSIVTRSPACQLSASAMNELDRACDLMEHRAASGRSAKAVVRAHYIKRCTTPPIVVDLLTFLAHSSSLA